MSKDACFHWPHPLRDIAGWREKVLDADRGLFGHGLSEPYLEILDRIDIRFIFENTGQRLLKKYHKALVMALSSSRGNSVKRLRKTG